MAEENVQESQSGEAGQNQTANTSTSGTNGSGAEGKTYTQGELDRMFAERARQAESSLLKKLGFEHAEDATAALVKLRSIEDGQKSELQKAQEKIAELERHNTEQSERQKEMTAQYEVLSAAGKLGIVDPDAAFRLLDQGKLAFDKDTGKPTNVEQLLKELLTDKPWLTGAGTSASNRARNHGDSDDPFTTALRKGAGLSPTKGV